jgi:hypothetical protein
LEYKSQRLGRASQYFIKCIEQFCGPGSSVGIATDYGLDGPGIDSKAHREPALGRPITPRHIPLAGGRHTDTKIIRNPNTYLLCSSTVLHGLYGHVGVLQELDTHRK